MNGWMKIDNSLVGRGLPSRTPLKIIRVDHHFSVPPHIVKKCNLKKKKIFFMRTKP